MNIRHRFLSVFVALLFILFSYQSGFARNTERITLVPIERQMGDLTSAIHLEPGRALRVEKIPISDCRLGKAFIDYPIDGRLETNAYHGAVNEYPAHSFTGHQYEFNKGNGLHITLADSTGFDAVLFRGDYRGVMYHNGGPFYPGETATKICDVSNASYAFRRTFPQRYKLSRVNLYYTGERPDAGDLCDVSFLRLERSHPEAIKNTLSITEPATDSELFQTWAVMRFGEGASLLSLEQTKPQPLSFDQREFIHLLTPPQDPAQGLNAVTFQWSMNKVDNPTYLTFRTQDPLDPRRELMSVDCIVDKPGNYQLTLDFPDQVFLPNDLYTFPLIYGPPLAPPPQLWISIGAQSATKLADLQVGLDSMPYAKALPQALAQRKLMLKGLFYIMSEPRPWMALYAQEKGVNIREWLEKEQSPLVGKRGRSYRKKLKNLFETVEQCRVLAPDDDIVRQYHEWIFQGAYPPEPWQIKLPDIPNAPHWAVLLHQAYLGARSIPEWWLSNRLAEESGELGSLVADDVDLMQQWASFPMVEDAPLGETLRDMGQKLADMAIKLNLADNYLNIVKHSPHHCYEEGINQLALNAWWHYGDPVHYERAMRVTESISRLTVKTSCGHIHFRDLILQESDLYMPSPLGIAGHTHPVLLHPAYEVAWYNQNPTALDFYSQWADGWIAHQEVGNYARRIDVKTGEVVMADKAAVGGGGYRSQGISWLGIYELTKDPRFLKPFTMAFDAGHGSIRAQYAANYINASHFREHIKKKENAAEQLSGYAHYLFTGKTDRLETALESAIREWQQFGYLYTEAEQFTDRIYNLPFKDVLNCYLGNYTGRNIFPHNFAVSYEGLGKNFAALVGPSDEKSLEVIFFNFAKKDLKGRMRVWRLNHGRYKMRVGPDSDNDGKIDHIALEKTITLHRHAPIELSLPPNQLTRLEIEQIEQLDNLLDRADLALSPLDTKREVNITWQYDTLVRIRVHNIGAHPAEQIEIALIRQGEKIATRLIPEIEAPHDLKPRMAITYITETQPGDIIVVDPDNKIPEITESNNRLTVNKSGVIAWPND